MFWQYLRKAHSSLVGTMEPHLPRIKEHEPGRFPVIYLTNVDEWVRQKLEESIASTLDSLKDDSQYQGQKPLYVPATQHRYQLEKGKLDQIGIFSELYQIAAESRKKDWERVFLVDSRTVRQLRGVPRHAERDEVSVIVIRTRLDNMNIGGFFADVGRGFVDAAIRSVLFRDDKGIKDCFDRERYFTSYYEPWVGLYNPDLPPLSVEALSLAQDPVSAQHDAAACLSHFLPRELVDSILEFAKTDQPIEELTAAPERLDFRRSSVLVLSLIPLTEVRSARIDSMLCDALKGQGSDADLIIYPWLSSVDGRRRDLYRLYERAMNNHPGWKTHGWFLFLDQAILEPHPRVGFAYGNNSLELQIQYVLPEQVAKTWNMGCRSFLALWTFFKESSKNSHVEQLRDPGRKYAWDFPPFTGRFYGKMPVFLLSQSFTDDEIVDIKEKFDYRDMSILPWKKQQDGTEDDICKIFQDIGRLYDTPCVVFVDRQTLVDETVTVAVEWVHSFSEKEVDIPYDSALLGTRYRRVKAKYAGTMWANIDVVGFDEWVEEDETAFVLLPGVVIPDDCKLEIPNFGNS